MGAWEDGYRTGYNDAINQSRNFTPEQFRLRPLTKPVQSQTRKKPRRASAYSKRYGAAFKRIAPKNQKKGGGWKQGGFMRTQKAAHRAARK